MEEFNYSPEFKNLIIRLHRGKESWPNYQEYIDIHLGGPNSRVVQFGKHLTPEIEYHCGDLKNKRILDFGCGTGSTTVALAQESNQVIAFDIDQESLNICKRRIREHGLQNKVRFSYASDFDQVKKDLGKFDLILLNGVIEHIPLSQKNLRRKILLSVFDSLKTPGYLFINETPNRLWPYDFHSTQLWWIPWSRPGSNWAYQKALNKGRHSDAPTISPGPLGLEEVGAWGATYWEIKKYFQEKHFICVNTLRGYDRYLYYRSKDSWPRRAFYTLVYFLFTKSFNIPITAFGHSLSNLVFKKY